MHIDGVKQMVTVRGGLSKVKQTSPLTARMVPWYVAPSYGGKPAANSFLCRVSLLVSGSPQFETQDDSGRGDGICAVSQWQSPFSVKDTGSHLLDFDKLDLDPALRNIANRLRSILHSPAILSATDLHDLTCFTLHRLLSLPPLPSVGFPEFNTSECMRYAISAYMFIIHGPTYYSHVHLLNTLIIQLKSHINSMLSWRECQDSMLLWLLSVGAVASIGTNENDWFCNEAGTIAGTLGARGWDDIEMHLSKVLWLGTRSSVLFQQTWEDILASASALGSLVLSDDHEYRPNFPTRVA